MVYTYLITGSNKGIGLAVVEELVKKENVKVIATVRSPAKAIELKKLAESTKKVEIVELDVLSRTSIDKLAAQLEKVAPEGIDFFIGNAGVIAPHTSVTDTTYEDYLNCFQVNVLGNVFVFKAVYPFMLKKETRKVVFTSSISGSLTGFLGLSQGAYGSSKSAINYITKALTVDHGADGFTFVTTHPGLVDTDMTLPLLIIFGPELVLLMDVLKPKDSAVGLVKLYDSITPSYSGKFYNYDGSELPF